MVCTETVFLLRLCAAVHAISHALADVHSCLEAYPKNDGQHAAKRLLKIKTRNSIRSRPRFDYSFYGE